MTYTYSVNVKQNCPWRSNRPACSARTAASNSVVHVPALKTPMVYHRAHDEFKYQQPCQGSRAEFQLQVQHASIQQPSHYVGCPYAHHTWSEHQQPRQPSRNRQQLQTATPAGLDQPTCTVHSSSIPQQQLWAGRPSPKMLAKSISSHTDHVVQVPSTFNSRASHKGLNGAIATSSSSRDDRCTPEPPATAGAPPPQSPGSSSSKQQLDSPSASAESQRQQEVQSASPATSTKDDIDAAVDAMLDKTWKELKRDLKKDLPPEQAAMIDKWDVSDIQTDRVFREIAEQQLGPILELMGIKEDPYAFFIDMFKLALTMQLLSAAVVFYGAELRLGLDAGDAFRAVSGLVLGYFLRLSIKIEHLAGPLYNMFVQLLIQDNAVYEPAEAKPGERLATLNKLGLTIACAFFIPKLLFGWQNDDCWQIVVPMVSGLFLFDVCYILALLIKLWGRDED